MVRNIEGDRDHRPPERALGLVGGLDDIYLSGESFELPMQGEQRGSPVDAGHVAGLLVLLGLVFIVLRLIVIVVIAASGRMVTPVVACTAATTLSLGNAAASAVDTTTSTPATVGEVLSDMTGPTVGRCSSLRCTSFLPSFHIF